MLGSIIGSVIGGIAQNSAANKAAKASREALAAQQAQLDKSWNAVDPYMKAGSGALTDMISGDYTKSPGYEFRLNEGLDAVGTNKAVNSMLRSGGALKALTKFGQDYATNDYNRWFAEKQSIANMGLQGASIGAGVTSNAVDAIGKNATNQGNAAMAQGNAWAGVAGTVGGAYDRMGSSLLKGK